MTGSGGDFTSSLFLGLRHGSAGLPEWAALTTGVPAALAEREPARRVAAAVAASQRAQAGVAARSALHALMDVLGTLPRRGDVVAIDAAAYPITEWAALRAAARGAVVRRYPHHRPELLRPPRGRRLVVVADGWCAGCGRPAPLPRLRSLAHAGDGVLVVDDSLAFGVLGRRDGPGFGDGTGTPRWWGLGHEGVVWVASLAKAYGAPMAVTTGPRDLVARLAAGGGNRTHSSPPTAADVAAATRALDDPDRNAARRARLLRHTRVIGDVLGLRGPPFPMVSIRSAGPDEARRWWRALRRQGIATVPQRSRCRDDIRLTALLRADHSERDVARLAAALRQAALRQLPPRDELRRAAA
ncbi:hypothetical protein Ade02nite_14160 [Paractinoplanes deccanensis]|uniref:8-amino-7-oxononanoate synthase n=1 Tax=Paractinoplanes deccanensis TaxID=113561 RepID=A0ABQ3XYG9_9ACTN|nr:aminotransferase class I/II-fold pyridoxal phosphate-dependent enzyme [Actinoplanes deccanensis]GID72775.1 hypothetical protein Ade02nite_14160 [Actinoplanes deccanensis]